MVRSKYFKIINITTDLMIHHIDDYRADLVPAVHKLVQKLGGWDDDEAYPLDLIKALPTLAEHSTSSLNGSVTHPNFSPVQSEEFRSKLKHIVPILMEKLQKGLHGYVIDCTCPSLTYLLDLRNNTLDQDSDKNKVAFYQEACKLISKLCDDTGMAPCATCVLKWSLRIFSSRKRSGSTPYSCAFQYARFPHQRSS
jgi:hypothetical protein